MANTLTIPDNGWYKLSEQSPENTGNYLCITNDDKVMVCHVATNGWWSKVPDAAYYGDMGKKVVQNSQEVEREVIWWKHIGDLPQEYTNELNKRYEQATNYTRETTERR